MLLEYIRAIDFLCVRLGVINQLFAAPFSSESYRIMVQQTFGNGDAYPEYRHTHHLVEQILRKDYPGLLEKADWMKPEWKVREKGSGGKRSIETDPNKQLDPNSCK
jgi:hypothetical protein